MTCATTATRIAALPQAANSSDLSFVDRVHSSLLFLCFFCNPCSFSYDTRRLGDETMIIQEAATDTAGFGRENIFG